MYHVPPPTRYVLPAAATPGRQVVPFLWSRRRLAMLARGQGGGVRQMGEGTYQKSILGLPHVNPLVWSELLSTC